MKKFWKIVGSFFAPFFFMAILAVLIFPKNESGSVDIPLWYPNTAVIVSIVIALVLNKRNKKTNKSPSSSADWKSLIVLTLTVVILAFVLSGLLALNKATNGFAIPLFLIAIIALGLWVFINRLITNRYMRQNSYHIVFLNRKMNASQDLDEYFKARDELLTLLREMVKREFWIGKKYALIMDGKKTKPSKIMSEIEQNESAHVHSAILRESANLRLQIKRNGPGASVLFSNHISKYASKLSTDNLAKARICLQSLQEYEIVAGKIEEVDSMEGHQFEYWCADLLEMNGFSNVEVTRGSGDQGVDIIATKDGIKYAVQCKCYSSDLGNKPVQEVHTGKSIYHCQVGAVMTNRYFTAGAKEAAEATGVLLWDRDRLVEMLGHETTSA